MQLGDVLISPSRRRIEGPKGKVSVEPRTMQVFVLLLDAGGKVVTRNQLFDECWGGTMVGDDSLNRAIGKVRKIAAETAPGFFEVETIPRTGYRLIGEILTHLEPLAEIQAGTQPAGVSRRTVVAGAVAAAAVGGFGLWWRADRDKDREFRELVERGLQKLDYRDGDASGEFRRALALRPDEPRALGLFAYAAALRTEISASTDSEQDAYNEAVQEAEAAARKALAIDPKEPSALLAQIVLERLNLDFAGTEDRLREVLAVAPDNDYAMRHLWDFLQCVGRCQDALAMAERAVSINPLSAGHQFPRAQLLWIVGRTSEADRVIDRARNAWPEHRTVRFAQFTILAFTGRARAALDMLDEPMSFSPALKALWKVNLIALDRPTPANIAAARQASLEGARQRLGLSNSATMVMSKLGEVDAAFEIVKLRYGIQQPLDDAPPQDRGSPKGVSTAWRFAPWLFTPPVAAVRADYRFEYICDEIGLTDYWAKRGIKPDYQLNVA